MLSVVYQPGDAIKWRILMSNLQLDLPTPPVWYRERSRGRSSRRSREPSPRPFREPSGEPSPRPWRGPPRGPSGEPSPEPWREPSREPPGEPLPGRSRGRPGGRSRGPLPRRCSDLRPLKHRGTEKTTESTERIGQRIRQFCGVGRDASSVWHKASRVRRHASHRLEAGASPKA